MDIIAMLITGAICLIIEAVCTKIKKSYVLSFTIDRLHWIRSNLTTDFIVSHGLNLVNQEYCLRKRDAQYIPQIFQRFIYYMEQLSLRENIHYKKEYRKLSVEEYAMYFLFCFLCNEDCRNTEIAKYSSRDTGKTIYTLTDYGYTLYRILHIASVYCEQSANINKYIRCTHISDLLQESLDTGNIIYYKY